jgi:hypothetical protein
VSVASTNERDDAPQKRPYSTSYGVGMYLYGAVPWYGAVCFIGAASAPLSSPSQATARRPALANRLVGRSGSGAATRWGTSYTANLWVRREDGEGRSRRSSE